MYRNSVDGAGRNNSTRVAWLSSGENVNMYVRIVIQPIHHPSHNIDTCRVLSHQDRACRKTFSSTLSIAWKATWRNRCETAVTPHSPPSALQSSPLSRQMTPLLLLHGVQSLLLLVSALQSDYIRRHCISDRLHVTKWLSQDYIMLIICTVTIIKQNLIKYNIIMINLCTTSVVMYVFVLLHLTFVYG